MTVALVEPEPDLPPQQLSDDEKALLGRLRGQLRTYARANSLLWGYYEAAQRVRDLGISIPPQLKDLEVAVGWSGTAVDVLAERLVWDNYSSTGDLMGLDEVYRQNHLDVEQAAVKLPALITGLAFTATGRGATGEPDVLVTAESPLDCTVMWDNRQRRVTSAYSRTTNQHGTTVMESLYLPDQTIMLERTRGRGMVVVDRDQHDLDRVLVATVPNRTAPPLRLGRSEITRTVRSLTDHCVRTLLGMEVNREFYVSPMRYLMGADEEQFVNTDGTKASAWDSIMGHMLSIPKDDDGDVPTIGQFSPASPEPFVAQIRVLAQLFAAEVGIPSSYLGFTTENPASADAIKAGESRLISTSRERIATFSKGWWDTAYNALLVRDGSVDLSELSKVRPNWTDPATPTPAAEADAATKLVAAGILDPQSQVTQQRVGLGADERATIAGERRRNDGRGVVEMLRNAAQATAGAVSPAPAVPPAGVTDADAG